MSELRLRPRAGRGPTQGGAACALRYPGFWKLFLIATVIGILTSLRYHFESPGLAFVLACTASYYPWIALTPAVFRMEKKFPLGADGWLRNVAALAGFSVPVSLLASPVMVETYRAVVSGLDAARTPPEIPWFVHIPLAQVLFWSSVAGGYLIRTQFQLREQEQTAARLALEKSQLEAGLKQAQLEALRARLNPHFLFNSLQNISVVMKQDPTTASRMLVRLGDLLRVVLRQDSEPECTLQEEIELARAYVSLEQLRFGDRLQVEFRIAPETQPARVPCFVLQPLIENAVVHGLRGVHTAGVISVSAEKDGEHLVLKVTDNGAGLPVEGEGGVKMGIGLGSTRERLATMYGDCHAFTLRRLPEGGTEARIVIPFRATDYGDTGAREEQPAVLHRG